MSDNHTTVLEPDPSGRPDEESGGKGRRGLIVAVVSAVVVALLAGSAFAAYKLLFATGTQAAEALPASTLGMVTLDLNPSAGQKVSAIRTLRKFPALRDELGIEDDDDLRELVFEEALADKCDDLDYADDVEPWLGKKVALGAVDLDGTPAPVLALEITDKSGAESGMEKVVECGEPGDDFFWTVTDDYVIASDSQEHADAIVDAAAEKSLADDAAYQQWSDELGDAGVVNFYVAEGAKRYLVDAMAEGGPLGQLDDLAPGGTGDLPDGFPSDEPENKEDLRKAVEEQLEEFTGMAGTVRFADGGMELAVTASGMKDYTGESAVGEQVGKLPADTAALLAFSVPGDLVERIVDQVESVLGEDEVSRGLAQLESEIGITPDDVQTLLGKALTLSLGGDAPASLEELSGPGDLPFGLLIGGESEEIGAVVEKIESRFGASLGDLPLATKEGDGKFALAANEEYADALLASGKLADDGTFKTAVPEADKAQAVFFVDFDSEWVEAIAGTAENQGAEEEAGEIRQNLEPLEALGVSAWQDGDTAHLLVKVTTE